MSKLLKQIKTGWWLCLVTFAEWADLMAYEPSDYHLNFFWSELTGMWTCFTYYDFDTENDN